MIDEPKARNILMATPPPVGGGPPIRPIVEQIAPLLGILPVDENCRQFAKNYA